MKRLFVITLILISIGVVCSAKDVKIWPDGDESRKILVSNISDDGKTIYFLTHDDFDYQVMKLEQSGETSTIATFPWDQSREQSRFMFSWILQVDDFAVIVSDRYKLYVGVIGQSDLKEIKKIPFRISALWIHKKRVFILGDTNLISCDLSGKDRQTHFAASQTEKALSIQNEQPDSKVFYGCSTGNNDEILLCIAGGRSCAIWSWDLNTRALDKQATLPGNNVKQWANVTRQGDRLFFYWALNLLFGQASGATELGAFLEYDITKRILIVRAYREKIPWRKQFGPDSPSFANALELDEAAQIGGAWRLSKNMLLCNGISLTEHDYNGSATPGNAKVIELDKYPNGRKLNLPIANGLYPFPDAEHLIAVEYSRIMKITPEQK